MVEQNRIEMLKARSFIDAPGIPLRGFVRRFSEYFGYDYAYMRKIWAGSRPISRRLIKMIQLGKEQNDGKANG